MFKLYSFLLLFSVSSLLTAADIPAIAAASSMKFALTDIVAAFHKETGKMVRISYSSSGNLTRQIQQGAPYQLFLSANNQYINQLYQRQLTENKGISFALGRLALLSNKSIPLDLSNQLDGLKAMLQQQEIHHFAIANPTHAPYGIAAREVLKNQGLWQLIQEHLVLGENAAQATQFVSSGAAEMALVSYSLALAPAIQKTTHSVLISSALHKPLNQAAVLLKNAGDTAKLFFRFLQQDESRQILSHYGYSKP